MTHDDFHISPFTRSIEGPRGTVLLRRHSQHASRCAEAIRRRDHPSWSSQRIEWHVTGASA